MIYYGCLSEIIFRHGCRPRDVIIIFSNVTASQARTMHRTQYYNNNNNLYTNTYIVVIYARIVRSGCA